MNEVTIMGMALIAAGVYISYQYYVINKYRRWIAMATLCLEQAYVMISKIPDDDDE